MRLGLLKVRVKGSFAFALSISILLLFPFLTRCDGQSTTTTSRKLFVVNSTGDSVSVFDLDEILTTEPDENGDVNVFPVRTIGSVTGLSTPQGIFVDTVNNEIFVANRGNNSITVYDNDRTEQGNIDVPPKRTIRGPDTDLSSPVAVFVDSGEVFVVNSNLSGGLITVYVNNRSETGDVNVSPIRTIRGKTTKLFVPSGIFVDANEIFIADFSKSRGLGNVLVFKRTANSDEEKVRPERVITIMDKTDEGFPFLPTSVYVDAGNNELFVAAFGIEFDGVNPPFPTQEGENLGSTIKVYERTADDTDAGDSPSPLRTVGGSSTGLLNPLGVFVDTQADEIFAVNFFNNTVTVYDDRSKTDLNDPPSRTLFIRDTNNSGFRGDRFNSAGIFVDAENGEMFVVNRNNTITVYGIADKGNADPRRAIGSNTGLLEPRWIHVDTTNGEIFVSNFTSRLITVYDITDDGNVPPLRAIAQGLSAPTGISVDAENDVLFAAGILPSFHSVRTYRASDGSPLDVIFGSDTGLGSPEGVHLDAESNEIFVANSFVFERLPFPDTITVYDSEDSGNIFPKRTIVGPDTDLSCPNDVFVDTEYGEIFVANFCTDAITVYENNQTQDDQNISPKRTIEGPSTKLLGLKGVFVDTQYNLIFATNASEIDNRITVYENDRTATDDQDAPPFITIRGPRTGLSKPVGISVTESP